MLRQYEITINGLVQGVGFRPFIYRLAHDLNLCGTVANNTSGVLIQLQSTVDEKDMFIDRIRREKPLISEITHINIQETSFHSEFHQFIIAASNHSFQNITRISPDIAICNQCMPDYHYQPHRINYPFTNCTYCGPRFSIVQSIPYDRAFTTMNDFEMCDICRAEYNEVEDRRFHAQPVACNHCGPSYTALYKNIEELNEINDYTFIVDKMIDVINSGGIVALKGIGGFNWLADAFNKKAVLKLRTLKRRYSKPFAVMCNDEEWLNDNMYVNQCEKDELHSWRRAIVLLNEKKKISEQINGDLKTIGVILPYLPIHYELFAKSGLKAIVFTSANKAGEPMLCDNDEARDYLIEHSDLYVEHNREIYNRVDDSVVRIIDDNVQVMRRARGYAPEPIINIDFVDGGLAFGAEMTAVFALGIDHQILMSQYIGDLSDYEVYETYKETLKRLSLLFKFTPHYLVCDNHPQYLSSRLAWQMAKEKGIPLYQVQHHHAHAVSVMVEYDLNETCLALSMDGVGYGIDGHSWGCEVLICDRIQFDRLTHLPYVSLPGGDKAAKECWRMAASYYYSIYGTLQQLPQSLVDKIGKEKINQLERLLTSKLNCYFTSSAGRLFDAVSAILGICYVNTYQAEAAMKLEQTAASAQGDIISYPIDDTKEWDVNGIFDGIIHDLKMNIDVDIIAMRFHRTLVAQLISVLDKQIRKIGLHKILLTGGVFQNRLLSELLIKEIKMRGWIVCYPTNIPCNDGGIAVGQLGIVSALLNQNK